MELNRVSILHVHRCLYNYLMASHWDLQCHEAPQQCQCICDMTIDDVNTVRSIGADCAMLRKHLRADSCCYRTAVEIDVQKVTWQTASFSTLSSQASLVGQSHWNCLLLQVLLCLGFVPLFNITFVIMFRDTLYNIGIKYFAIGWHCLFTCSVISGHSILCFSLHAP